MREARLIIPLWGEVYAQKLISITLPALLAPGNLPALRTMFDVEIVLVTESRLFDSIRSGKSFQLVSGQCRTRLVSLDDLMTDVPGDYGVVLTYALFRGFTDLGAKMTETYLLFLNADFIICDGSLRHLGELMLQGKRVIHAPSFRVVLEEVWPKLKARVDPTTSVLSMSPREMVKLALSHKHLTVKARTVNQKLCHQTLMDQFYWYVDDDTLIGYQWPVALVAIRPERVVSEPVLVWDYGFLPEAAPTAETHFISDSDNFFMLEPQKRRSGTEMVRLGWISIDEIARRLARYATLEQRECGRQLLKIHAGDLPPNTDVIARESNAYIAQLIDRMPSLPQPHIGHGLLGEWFEGAKERMRGRRETAAALSSCAGERSALPVAGVRAAYSRPRDGKGTTLGLLQAIYRRTFGIPPEVGMAHPLWIDLHEITSRVAAWRKEERGRILWMASRDSVFHRLLEHRIDPAALFVTDVERPFGAGAPYDCCLCELTWEEFADLRRIYAAIRLLMQDHGEVIVFVSTDPERSIKADDPGVFDDALPDVDVSEIHFFGSRSSAFLRRRYLRASRSFPNGSIFRGLVTAAVLIVLAPLVRVVNGRANRRQPMAFSKDCTSFLIDFKIMKAEHAQMQAVPR
jgi:hypothetical protein